MLVAESRVGRRLVGTLDLGADVLESLSQLCSAHHVRSGELRAFGSLTEVVICEYDQREHVYRPARRFVGPCEILSLLGNVSEKDGKLYVQASITISRERDNGIELLGGHLVSARAFAVELVVDCFDDLVLRRARDAATGLSLLKEAIAVGVPPPATASTPASRAVETAPPIASTAASVGSLAEAAPPPAAPSAAWAQVIAASAEPAAPPVPEAVLRPGDLIEHPKFGLCQVERIEGDFEFVSARMKNQRLIRLSLEVLSLVLVGHEGDKQLFRALSGR